jgi:hypothetical protein
MRKLSVIIDFADNKLAFTMHRRVAHLLAVSAAFVAAYHQRRQSVMVGMP